ncbi:MAG TPA: SDR family oxidoreductase [Sphingomicrobium sp.]|nr:SDR family oxidoreductase [Sphingomicrobium sp.]
MTKKVAMIIGAGSGMGAACARRLGSGGFRIAVLSASGKGHAIADEFGGIGVTGSNRSDEDIKRLSEMVLGRWGRIDVLVNSAGHGPRGTLLELSDDDWLQGMEVYLLNVVRAVRTIAPIMAAQHSGSIINISSAWAVEPSSLFPTSGVARAGLAAYTKLIADEFAAQNVRMNNVLPGWIDSLPPTDERRTRVPMRRYGRVGEVAALVAFLASDDAAYITGQNIRIDGGLTRSF